MAQFVDRDLEEEVKARLKQRTARHGRSREEEIRHTRGNAAKESDRPIAKFGSRIARRFRRAGMTTDLPELRAQAARLNGSLDHPRHERSLGTDAHGEPLVMGWLDQQPAEFESATT